jgi:hypothetical protein
MSIQNHSQLRGIDHYKSRSGYHCIRVHYSADPAKDPDTPHGLKWRDKEAEGYVGGMASSQWRQEMEIDWDAAGGDLVFPQFELYKSKIIAIPFEVPESWSKYASFDYGHRNPSSFHVYAIDHDGDVWVVWEYYQRGQGYRRISQSIRSCPFFDSLSFMPIADPSIWAKTQQVSDGNELKSVAQLFFELPEDERVIFAPGKSGGDITVAEKINGELWNEQSLREGKSPRLKIMATCPMLIWELSKLRYQDWSGTMAEVRNVKEAIVDKDNHAFDDMKMFFTQFFMSPTRPEKEKYEDLKKTDPASYREWMAVDRMHGEEASMKAGMGEFDDWTDDD